MGVVSDPFGALLTPGSPVQQSDGKKSWTELQRCVKDTRKLNSAMCNRVLSSFSFRHLQTESGRLTRLYFLGVPTSGFLVTSNTLLYVDLPPADPEAAPSQPIESQELLEAFRVPMGQSQLSREEQLLRERKRLASLGITSYDADLTTGTFVFPSCNSLFMCTDSLTDTDSFMASTFLFYLVAHQPSCYLGYFHGFFVHFSILWTEKI